MAEEKDSGTDREFGNEHEQETQPPGERAKIDPTKTSFAVRLGIVLLFVLVLGLSGAFAYLWYQGQQSRQLTQTALQARDIEHEKHRGAVNTLSSRMDALGSQLNDIKREREQVGMAYSDLGLRIDSLSKQLASVSGVERVDWQIREAGHFIYLADRRMVLTRDVEGTHALLQEADEIVALMHEPLTRNLRRALAQDMQTLSESMASQVDVEGVYFKLAALRDRVSELAHPAFEFKTLPDQASGEIELNPEDMSIWEKFVAAIRKLYRFHDRAKPVPTLPGPEHAVLIQDTLYMLIGQAQLNALRYQQASYIKSLEQIEDWLSRHIDTETAVARSMVDAVSTLKAVDISPTVPDIRNTVQAYETFVKVWGQEKLARQKRAEAVRRQSQGQPEPPASNVGGQVQ